MAIEYVPFQGPVVTRQQAKSAGLQRYFMGPDKPCKRGHISERKTCDGRCIQCTRIASMDADQIEAKRRRTKAWDDEHREEKNSKQAERYLLLKKEAPERLREEWRRYYRMDPARSIARTQRWQAKNEEHLKAYREANKEKLQATAAAWAKANPEKRAATTRRWQERNPDKVLAYRIANKEKIEQTTKAWKKANPDKVRANVRKWHAANPDAVKKWRKANPEAWRAQVQRRRALMANAEGYHTGAELKALLEQQNWRCIYCGRSIRTKYSVDHIQALSRGGTNWIANIQLLCQPCNSSKQDADALEFARRNGRLL